MRRRRLLTLLGAVSLGGCTGGPGDSITALAVNKDETAHTVSMWVARDDRLVVSNAVKVAGGEVATLGETPWRRGRYRVTVRVDGNPEIAESFRSTAWFNQLDAVVDTDGTAELHRGRAA